MVVRSIRELGHEFRIHGDTQAYRIKSAWGIGDGVDWGGYASSSRASSILFNNAGQHKRTDQFLL